MIWLSTYCALVTYTAVVALFVPVPLISFLLIAGVFHLGFISSFLLTKYNYAELGKHTLILTTYAMLVVFDHMHQKQTFIFLYFLAFLPAALNVFHFKKNWAFVYFYILFPLGYILFTKLFTYSYPSFEPLPYKYVQFVASLNILLTFILFVLFASYMIYNSQAKQHKMKVFSAALQTTLDNSAAAIWSIDNDFNLMATNIKYAESLEYEFGVTGLKPGINLKKHLIWQKLPTSLKVQYHEVLEGNEVFKEIDLNGKCFEIKGVPIYDNNIRICGATFGSRDITARKKADEALLHAKKEAEEASMTKTRFLSNMSHEIRTPLNGIIGITRIMQDEPNLPEQLPMLKTLQDISEHTLQLVNNILDFAKIEAGKASLESARFNLLRFIEKTNSIFLGMAKLRGIELKVETEGNTDVYVKGDEVRLSQILINLLGNAFKFTEEGKVTLKIKITENADANYYNTHFCVMDTGIGIKKENIGKIFESFSQADTHTTRQFGGTGLGLSIADKILKLMNSHLTVESEFGKGSSFAFDIVLLKSSFINNNVEASVSKTKPSLSHLNILVAEDNKVNQMVAKRMLEKWESSVTIASNGKEAVNFVLKNKFDVILMDLDMPIMDGYECINIIKKSFPKMPVIALTAAAFDDMDNFLINKGFSEVVQKPFFPDDLYNKIVSIV